MCYKYRLASPYLYKVFKQQKNQTKKNKQKTNKKKKHKKKTN